MQKYDIVTAKKYTKNGEEKTQWNNVGSLTYFDPTPKQQNGGFALELNMFPETKFMVFERKPKENEQPKQERNTFETYEPTPEEMKASSPLGNDYPVEGDDGVPDVESIPF